MHSSRNIFMANFLKIILKFSINLYTLHKKFRILMTSLACEMWLTIGTERFWQISAGPTSLLWAVSIVVIRTWYNRLIYRGGGGPPFINLLIPEL